MILIFWIEGHQYLLCFNKWFIKFIVCKEKNKFKESLIKSFIRFVS